MDEVDAWVPMPRFLLRQDAVSRVLKDSDVSGKKVLEIGFGSGEMLKWLIAKGAKVSGVDFSASAHELAKKRVGSFLNGNGSKLYENIEDVKDEKYDFICAFEVLEHIDDDVGTINQWMDMLKCGGHLLISVPAHMKKWGDIDVWAGHCKRYERNDFYELVPDEGAKILQLWNYGFPLSIVLDRLLNRSAKNKNREDFLSTGIEKTKRSGVDRSVNPVIRFLSRPFFMFPFFILQRLFFKFDFGSAYLVHFQKAK